MDEINYLFAYLQIALSQLDKTSKSSKKFETCGNPFVKIRWSNCITVAVVRYGFIFAKVRSIHFFQFNFYHESAAATNIVGGDDGPRPVGIV